MVQNHIWSLTSLTGAKQLDIGAICTNCTDWWSKSRRAASSRLHQRWPVGRGSCTKWCNHNWRQHKQAGGGSCYLAGGTPPAWLSGERAALAATRLLQCSCSEHRIEWLNISTALIQNCDSHLPVTHLLNLSFFQWETKTLKWPTKISLVTDKLLDWWSSKHWWQILTNNCSSGVFQFLRDQLCLKISTNSVKVSFSNIQTKLTQNPQNDKTVSGGLATPCHLKASLPTLRVLVITILRLKILTSSCCKILAARSSPHFKANHVLQKLCKNMIQPHLKDQAVSHQKDVGSLTICCQSESDYLTAKQMIYSRRCLFWQFSGAVAPFWPQVPWGWVTWKEASIAQHADCWKGTECLDWQYPCLKLDFLLMMLFADWLIFWPWWWRERSTKEKYLQL